MIHKLAIGIVAILLIVPATTAHPEWSSTKYYVDNNFIIIEENGVVETMTADNDIDGILTQHDEFDTWGTLAHDVVAVWTPPVSYNLALYVWLDDTTPANAYLNVGRMPHPADDTIYCTSIKEGQYYTHSGSDTAHPIYWNYENSFSVDYNGTVSWYWN
jgi:hypothetical protein